MNRFDDIIFKDRNKSYGAYLLRKRQYRAVNVSTLIAVSVFSLVFLFLLVYYGLQEELISDSIVEYDESVMANPYQADFQMDKPNGNPKKSDQKKTAEIIKDIEDGQWNLENNDIVFGDSLGTGEDTVAGVGHGANDTIGSDFNTSRDPNEVYNLLSYLDELPMFPGGEAARVRFFHDRLKYPKFALDNKIQGIVYVNFIVEPDSSITNVKVLQGIGAGCDEEAVKVVKAMPKWKPGVKDQRKIRVLVTMPLTFSLINQN